MKNNVFSVQIKFLFHMKEGIESGTAVVSTETLEKCRILQVTELVKS